MLHPGQFHLGLLARVLEAGARMQPEPLVTGMRREGAGWEVGTARGRIAADHLVVATNGYTGPATPWPPRRRTPRSPYWRSTSPVRPAIWPRIARRLSAPPRTPPLSL